MMKSVDKMFVSPQPYLETLYKAMLSMAYFGLFRVGEITQSPHVMKAADVHIGQNKDKIMIILHSSKTHGEGDKPQIIKLSAQKLPKQKMNNIICPFKNLVTYISIRKTIKYENEQFFVFCDHSPVTSVHFRNGIKTLIAKNNLDNTLYTSHSIRAGRVTDMVEIGIPIETIRKIGRWKSSAIYSYLRT